MSACRESDFNKAFYQELIYLRHKIASLPRKRRTELLRLADQIGEQHLRMQDSCDELKELTEQFCRAVEEAGRKLCAVHQDNYQSNTETKTI